MRFADELAALLPEDLPHRKKLIENAAHHLDLIVEANRQFNLTRITGEREAAIKHVLDSVSPWRLFSGAKHVVDAGTGAGFPGIPLALVLPEVQFTLSESTGKKARFVESAIDELGLANVSATTMRAEEALRLSPADIVTARAVAPLHRALALFGPAISQGARAVLYKGPDAEAEIAEAEAELRKRRISCHIAERYELPDGLGSRTIVELRYSSHLPPGDKK